MAEVERPRCPWRTSMFSLQCFSPAMLSLDEVTFGFNNRNNPYLFRDTLLKLIEAPVLEYKKLTAA
jgi:hypothetical protein